MINLGFWLPAVTDVYDDATRHAVIAFQKVEGLTRDGVAGTDTLTSLAKASHPTPFSSRSGAHLEVSLEHQVVYVVNDQGQVYHVFDASSGKASTPTPPGSFHVYTQVNGNDPGPNGVLYRPKYFNQGIAFHGYPDVPNYPASHGCIRLQNAAIDFFWSQNFANIGTPVVVV